MEESANSDIFRNVIRFGFLRKLMIVTVERPRMRDSLPGPFRKIRIGAVKRTKAHSSHAKDRC